MYQNRAEKHYEVLAKGPGAEQSDKIKTLGAFFEKFPNLQVALNQQTFIGTQLSTTPMEDEARRLRLVAQSIDNKRLCLLMDFRQDILENDDLSIEAAIQLIYIVKYKELEALRVVEMAYLWGVSVEYMSRVLKNTETTLVSIKEEFQEILYE